VATPSPYPAKSHGCRNVLEKVSKAPRSRHPAIARTAPSAPRPTGAARNRLIAPGVTATKQARQGVIGRVDELDSGSFRTSVRCGPIDRLSGGRRRTTRG